MTHTKISFFILQLWAFDITDVYIRFFFVYLFDFSYTSIHFYIDNNATTKSLPLGLCRVMSEVQSP